MDNHKSYLVKIGFPWVYSGPPGEPPPSFAHLRRQMDCFKYAQPQASTVSTKPPAPIKGWTVQGHIVRGTLHLSKASSKEKYSGTHRSGTDEHCILTRMYSIPDSTLQFILFGKISFVTVHSLSISLSPPPPPLVPRADIQRRGSLLSWIVILSVYGADTIAIDVSLSALIF